MFPRVIALFLSLLGATPLLAQEADGFAPRFVSSIPLFEDESAQPPKVFEIREQHVRVPTVDLTVETDDLWERIRRGFAVGLRLELGYWLLVGCATLAFRYLPSIMCQNTRSITRLPTTTPWAQPLAAIWRTN